MIPLIDDHILNKSLLPVVEHVLNLHLVVQHWEVGLKSIDETTDREHNGAGCLKEASQTLDVVVVFILKQLLQLIFWNHSFFNQVGF